MRLEDLYSANENEKPLDNIVTDGGFCGILRTIACVGDSLSSGELESLDENGNRGYHDIFDISWGQYMARMAGCTVYNFSCGGMTAKAYMEHFARENDMWNPDKAAQVYIIALGVNDVYYCKQEVGSIEDVCLEDYTKNRATFAGYYAQVIQKYKEIQPDAKFFLMTMPHSEDNGEFEPIGDAHSKLLYDMARLFDNTYVMDIRKYGVVYDGDFRNKFFVGGHMNTAGYLFTAKVVMSYIDYIIRHNMEDFSQIGFVGTPHKYIKK